VFCYQLNSVIATCLDCSWSYLVMYILCNVMECDLSHRAVNTALWCNFLVFSLKFGVWISTSSHVMLAELVHSVADFANQVSFFFCYASWCIYLSSLFHDQEQRILGLIVHQLSGSSCLWFEQLKTCSRCNTPVCIINSILLEYMLCQKIIGTFLVLYRTVLPLSCNIVHYRNFKTK